MAHFLSLLVENVTASMMWVVRIHMRHWNHNSSLDRAQSVFPSTLHKVSHHPQTEAVVVLSASLSDLSLLQATLYCFQVVWRLLALRTGQAYR